MEGLIERYGPVVVVSLIDQRGIEVHVGESFETHMFLLNNPKLKYVEGKWREREREREERKRERKREKEKEKERDRERERERKRERGREREEEREKEKLTSFQ